jgi:hypothetical protein
MGRMVNSRSSSSRTIMRSLLVRDDYSLLKRVLMEFGKLNEILL